MLMRYYTFISRCKDNWSGPDCNHCVPSSNCTHGYCVKPLECICKEGWKGEYCNETTVPKSFCSQRNPCQNNGTCIDNTMGNYSCECKRGFIGRNCQLVGMTVKRVSEKFHSGLVRMEKEVLWSL